MSQHTQSVWIDRCGRQHRAYWRTYLPAPEPKRRFEPFASRADAETFQDVVKVIGIQAAVEFARTPWPERRRELLASAAAGTSTLAAAAQPGRPRRAPIT